jgi:hypothetical protein
MTGEIFPKHLLIFVQLTIQNQYIIIFINNELKLKDNKC